LRDREVAAIASPILEGLITATNSKGFHGVVEAVLIANNTVLSSTQGKL